MALTSCFAGGGFALALPPGPAPFPPQADTVELTASCFKLMAALPSRSCEVWHAGHVQPRTNSGRLSNTYPQHEQVLLWQTSNPPPPPRCRTGRSCSRAGGGTRRTPCPQSSGARRRFFSMPDTFKSSIPITGQRRVRLVVSGCRASWRMLAIRAYKSGQPDTGLLAVGRALLLATQAAGQSAQALEQAGMGFRPGDHLTGRERGQRSPPPPDPHRPRFGFRLWAGGTGPGCPQ